jgi:DNA repair exonuclease SbcCD ATPase subunit
LEPIPPPADEEMEISEEDMLLKTFKEFLNRQSLVKEELAVVKRNYAVDRSNHRRLKRYVKKIEADMDELSEITKKATEMEDQLKNAEKEIRRLEVYEKCRICMENDKNIVLLPCQHYTMCEVCADKAGQTGNTCPICRTNISGFISGIKNV